MATATTEYPRVRRGTAQLWTWGWFYAYAPAQEKALSVDEVHKLLNGLLNEFHHRSISRSSVSRSMRELEALGMIRVVKREDRHDLYELVVEEFDED